MEQKHLGKIIKCTFGRGGYQEEMIGVFFRLGWDNGFRINDFWGYWNTNPSGAKWTDADRQYELGKVVMRIGGLIDDAKCHYLHELVGKPVEITVENEMLKSWRILKEVL